MKNIMQKMKQKTPIKVKLNVPLFYEKKKSARNSCKNIKSEPYPEQMAMQTKATRASNCCLYKYDSFCCLGHVEIMQN